jgi:hypothetical protein
MKLPRWLLWTMMTLSVFGTLAAAGWWWVTWPERTAREFIRLLRDGDIESINALIIPKTYWMDNSVSERSSTLAFSNEWMNGDGTGQGHRIGQRRGQWIDLIEARKVRQRTVADLFSGEMTFDSVFTAATGPSQLTVTVKRDKLSFWLDL